MIDRWTDSFFWPALIGAWLGAFVSLCAAVHESWAAALVNPTAIGLGALAATMFLLALVDAPTRKAVNSFNIGSRERSRSRSWWDRLFSPDYGDLRLLIINRLVWLEMVVFIWAGLGHELIAVICFESFALSTLMVMLMMKRRNANMASGS